MKKGIKEGYLIEEPIENLYKYKSHPRMRIFYHKGIVCSICKEKKGSHIVIGTKANGGLSVNIYTDKYELMNIDHIIPISKGGSRKSLDNLQPTCSTCNSLKSNIMPLSGGCFRSDFKPANLNSNRDKLRIFQVGQYVRYIDSERNRGNLIEYRIVGIKANQRIHINGSSKGRRNQLVLEGLMGDFHVAPNHVELAPKIIYK